MMKISFLHDFSNNLGKDKKRGGEGEVEWGKRYKRKCGAGIDSECGLEYTMLGS